MQTLPIAKIATAAVFAILLAGCAQSTPPAFSGRRTSIFQNGYEMLIVNKDGSYQQRITNKWHKLIFNANRWQYGQKPDQSSDDAPWIVLNQSIVAYDWCAKPRSNVTYTNSLIPTSTFDRPPSTSDGSVEWRNDIPSAVKEARGDGKILMIDFYTDWCGWCHKMDTDVYTDPKVAGAVNRFVPLRLNAEQDGATLADKYHVTGYPTILFVRPDGQEVDRIGGYEPADQFLQDLDRISSGG